MTVAELQRWLREAVAGTGDEVTIAIDPVDHDLVVTRGDGSKVAIAVGRVPV